MDALFRQACRDESLRPQFMARLERSEVVVVEMPEAKEGMALALLTVHDDEGPFTPVFLSEEMADFWLRDADIPFRKTTVGTRVLIHCLRAITLRAVLHSGADRMVFRPQPD
jgi:hypothetical protein